MRSSATLLLWLAMAGAAPARGAAAPEAGRAARWSPFAPIPPLEALEPPRTEGSEGWESPIDAFVLAALRAKGLEPAPEVGRRVWLRRVTFDLTGLPPSPEELDGFLGDPRPDAAARAAVVDRLLASAAYAERMARHWLDVVRFAESDGFAIDGERPTLWRYRDYVVRVFEEDRPFDRFVREQVAGDELEDAGSEGAIASGFLRLGPWEADNMVPELRRQDYLDEVTAATGLVFLGLTVGCARCHDHKYDPIPAADYYGLQAFFAPVERSERAAPFAPGELAPRIASRRRDVEEEHQRRREDLAFLRHRLRVKLAAALGKEPAATSEKELDEAIAAARDPITKDDKALHEKLAKAVSDFDEAERFSPAACTVADPKDGAAVPRTHVLDGGDVTSPREEVPPGFLTAAVWPGASELRERARATAASAAGRRRVLAEWLASPENPLVPRVWANRLWQVTIGRGIVATANDFGANGSGASHPELLDYLARRFLAGGWRTKPVLREIVLSRTFRASSVHPAADRSAEVDPENRFLWRAHHRRLESEVLRDAMLAASGELDRTRGGPGFYEELPAELGRDFPFFRWEPSSEPERRRRSLYMFQRRNLIVPLFEAFDAPDMTEPCGGRRVSVTTPQVFSLFNGKFAHGRSRALALRALREAGASRRAQVERMFLLAFARPPDARELEAARALVDDQLRRHLERRRGEPGKSARAEAEVGALADLALVIFNANEFIYLE